MGQQHARSAIVKHESQPIARISRIQRDVRTASLQYPEQTHEHFERTLYADANENAGTHSEVPQVTCQQIGAVIELPKRQLPVFEDSGNRVGCSSDLLFNQFVQHAVFARAGSCRVIQLFQNHTTGNAALIRPISKHQLPAESRSLSSLNRRRKTSPRIQNR